jgi:hypothetical protein
MIGTMREASSGALSTRWRRTVSKSPPLAASTLAASIIEPPPSATMTSACCAAAPKLRQDSTRSAQSGLVSILVIVATGAPAIAVSQAVRKRLEDRLVIGDERPAALADQAGDLVEQAAAKTNPDRIPISPLHASTLD